MKSILQKVLALVLALILTVSLAPLALAEGESGVYDNSDLGPDYADSEVYLGCDEYDGESHVVDDSFTDEYGSPVAIGASVIFKAIGKFAGQSAASYLMDKGMDQIWSLVFGGDQTAAKLDEIIRKLDRINQLLQDILKDMKDVEYRNYLNARLKDRIRLNAEIQDTLGDLRDIDKLFYQKKITAQQRYDKRVARLRRWDTKTINGNSSGFTATLAFANYAMQMKVRNRQYFGVVDDYAYNNYPFEHLGYGFRQQERAAETVCYAYASALSAMGLQVRVLSGEESEAVQGENQKLLVKTNEAYGKFIDDNKVTVTQDYSIIQISGFQGSKIQRYPVTLFSSSDLSTKDSIEVNVIYNLLHTGNQKLLPNNVMKKVREVHGSGYTVSDTVTELMGLLKPNYAPYMITSYDWGFSVGKIENFRFEGRIKAYGYNLNSKNMSDESIHACSLWGMHIPTRPNLSKTAKLQGFDPFPFCYGYYFAPSSRYVESQSEAQPSSTVGQVMHVDSEKQVLYVLCNEEVFDPTAEENVSYQSIIDMDISGAQAPYAPVNGLQVSAACTANYGEDAVADYTAVTLDMPQPQIAAGTVSLYDAGTLTVLDKDGNEHAFTLPEAMALSETPAEGMDVSVSYVPVTPIEDWLAGMGEEQAAAEPEATKAPESDGTPTEYVVSVALGENAISDTLDGTVATLAGEYMTVLDDQNAEHAFQLTEQTKLDEGVAEGAHVQVSYHISKEQAAIAEGVPVADGVALIISPIDPDTLELDGIIVDVNESTLTVFVEGGAQYELDITSAQIEGELAEGGKVHVTYHEAENGLVADEITSFAPDDDPVNPIDDPVVPDNDDAAPSEDSSAK